MLFKDLFNIIESKSSFIIRTSFWTEPWSVVKNAANDNLSKITWYSKTFCKIVKDYFQR